jgi:DNA polymerase III epsilon subunit-like protein
MNCKKCQDGIIYSCNNCGGKADYDYELGFAFCNTCEILREKYSVYSSECIDCNKTHEATNIDKKYILFFDTETTGLPKNWKAPVSDTHNWPRLVQLAYQLFDNNGIKITEQNFIIYPDGYSIPIDSTKIHGITQDMAILNGKPLFETLTELLSVINTVHTVVGHNIDYDIKVVGCEFIRNNIPNPFDNINKICTMESSTNFCAIAGPYGYKWPKLSELYYKLFQRNFEDAHNALIDIQATSECFWELVRKQIISFDLDSSSSVLDAVTQSLLFDEVMQSVLQGKENEKIKNNTCKKCKKYYNELVVYCNNCGEKMSPSKIDMFPYPNEEFYKLNNINEIDLYLAKDLGSEAIDEDCFYEAIEYFQKAIDLTNKNDLSNRADSLNGIGICYFKLNKFKEAANHFNELIELMPTFPFSYENLIVTYFNLNEYELMLDVCESMPKNIEVTPTIWLYVGKVNELKNCYSIARNAFQRAFDGGLDECFEDLNRILKKIKSSEKYE